MKMKRIAYSLLALLAVFLIACSDKVIIIDTPPGPGTRTDTTSNLIALRIVVPKNSVSTYAEDATNYENRIDTLFIDLYQDNLVQEEFKFYDLSPLSFTNDSIIAIDTITDKLIANKNVLAKVYANSKDVEVITTDIPLPVVGTPPDHTFFMSGEGSVDYLDGRYTGTIRVVRNVAKLRINISKHSEALPDNLTIDYENIKIKVLDAANQTFPFLNIGTFNDLPTTDYIDYIERTGITVSGDLRPASTFTDTDGGQIDSLYLYENYRSSYTSAGTYTQVQITIPTYSPSGGYIVDTYPFPLITNGSYHIFRNTIYTLDIQVRGQSLEPVITLDQTPWNDKAMPGDILGTYLTMEAHELTFNTSGEAFIDFCTDAQAVYFNFSDFNSVNTTHQIGFNNEHIRPIFIEPADPALAPAGYQDGQILLDKQHCARLGFKLDLDEFPKFPNISFSGRVCIRAGNIVKCLTFSGRRMYDAHFIVGEDLLESGDLFTSADVETDDGGNWLEVSPQKLYTTAANSSFSNITPTPLYLHLDENLTGKTRRGSITVESGGMEKKIYIEQLSALEVGRFGYTAPSTSAEVNVYNNQLYTEQLYEFKTLLPYKTTLDNTLPINNFIYNGLGITASTNVKIFANYDDASFNYASTEFQAMNYCLYKNRPSSKGATGYLTDSDIKWHLPSQAQLMAMWLSYESYKNASNSNFHVGKDSAAYWSATANSYYAQEVQYMNFLYGNIGHYYKNIPQKYWARCVRSGTSGDITTQKMVEVNTVGGHTYPTVDFEKGMPENSYTTSSKNNQREPETSVVNATLFKKLRVANQDVNVLGTDTLDRAYSLCESYREADGGPYDWRLPTQRELQAIWILQKEIKQICSSFEYFAEDYYWSNTYASETETAVNSYVYTSAFCLFGNRTVPGEASNMPHLSKSTYLKARCVREE